MCKLFIKPVCKRDEKRGGAADGGEGAGGHADEHHEREIAGRLCAEVDEREEGEDDGKRRVDRARHGLVDGLSYRVLK